MTSPDGGVACQASVDKPVSPHVAEANGMVDDHASSKNNTTCDENNIDPHGEPELDGSVTPVAEGDQFNMARAGADGNKDVKDKLEFINMFSTGGISRSKPSPSRINIVATTNASAVPVTQQPVTMKNLALHCVSPGLSTPSSSTIVTVNNDKQLRSTYLESRNIEAKQKWLISNMARPVANKSQDIWKSDMILSVSGDSDETVVVAKPISSLSTPTSTSFTTTTAAATTTSNVAPESGSPTVPKSISSPSVPEIVSPQLDNDTEPSPLSNSKSDISSVSESGLDSVSTSSSELAKSTAESTTPKLVIPPSYANRARSLRPRRFARPKNIQVYPFTNQFAGSNNTLIHSAPINGPSHIYNSAPVSMSTPISNFMPVPPVTTTLTPMGVPSSFPGSHTAYNGGFNFNYSNNMNQMLAFQRGPAPILNSMKSVEQNNRFSAQNLQQNQQQQQVISHNMAAASGRGLSSTPTLSMPLPVHTLHTSSVPSTGCVPIASTISLSPSPSSSSSSSSASSSSSSSALGSSSSRLDGGQMMASEDISANKRMKLSTSTPIPTSTSASTSSVGHPSQSFDSLKQCMVRNLVHSLTPSVIAATATAGSTTMARDTASGDSGDNNNNNTSTNISESEFSDSALQKKKRFLYLCSEMWDLIHN